MLELTLEKIRWIVMIIVSQILSAVTPTTGFVEALVIAWFFNVWCGMRADGVTNIKCKNFSWRKFLHAIGELLLFMFVMEIIAVVTYSCGDANEGIYAVKTINYIFMYVYFENGMKNLCKAYPDKKALWMLYLFVRMEFRKLFRIDEIINMYDEHIKKQNGNNKIAAVNSYA